MVCALRRSIFNPFLFCSIIHFRFATPTQHRLFNLRPPLIKVLRKLLTRHTGAGRPLRAQDHRTVHLGTHGAKSSVILVFCFGFGRIPNLQRPVIIRRFLVYRVLIQTKSIHLQLGRRQLWSVIALNLRAHDIRGGFVSNASVVKFVWLNAIPPKHRRHLVRRPLRLRQVGRRLRAVAVKPQRRQLTRNNSHRVQTHTRSRLSTFNAQFHTAISSARSHANKRNSASHSHSRKLTEHGSLLFIASSLSRLRLVSKLMGVHARTDLTHNRQDV